MLDAARSLVSVPSFAGGNMFLVECNHPGCKEHARFAAPNVNWNCGKHEQPKREKSYLPNRHPHRLKFAYGKHDNHK